MRLALVSPMPPSPSGIADYAAALAEALRWRVELEVISGPETAFVPDRFDAVLYQIGNNGCHAFAYEMALQHPGVVVLHEPNLHHLIAETTIKRGMWDAYLREVEREGGAAALAYARRVKALEAPPDYEGLPMLRRILERARGVVVHSRYAEQKVREAGFQGPLARIPHGAWITRGDRMSYRRRLGLDETTPLIGAFGFLKPYKRIPECLRAVARLVRLEPRAKMILAGEPHPDLPLAPLVDALEIAAHVRVLGRLPIEDFIGYMAACDVILNLRYPTAGENSGSLLRAMGMGKPVIVSDVGAFRELPDDVCLKVPIGAAEEETLFEFLNLLVSRPSLAAAMGARARRWVEKECGWERVADRHLAFLEALTTGADWVNDPTPEAASPPPPQQRQPPQPALVPAGREIAVWTPPDSAARDYLETHLTRFQKTLAMIPPGTAADRILEMGAYLHMTPLLRSRLGYGEVRGCYYGPAGKAEHKRVVSEDGAVFECDLELFDAERDRFPYGDGSFATVLCCELIEHLASDPMHMMAEINRVLRPGGCLVLTTPNLASLRGLSALLLGYHPGLYSVYLRPGDGDQDDKRHHREYTPIEIHMLLADSGFDVVRLETGPFRERPRPELGWVSHLLERYRLETELRGEGIYAVGRKRGPVRERYPSWLYAGPKP